MAENLQVWWKIQPIDLASSQTWVQSEKTVRMGNMMMLMDLPIELLKGISVATDHTFRIALIVSYFPSQAFSRDRSCLIDAVPSQLLNVNECSPIHNLLDYCQ